MLARHDHAETDRGLRHAPPASERLCVVTREVKPPEEMIRFVLGPDGAVVPDLKRKLPGRGVWLTARRDVVAQATRRGAFARAFRREVKVSPDLPGQVEALMERGLLDALAVARKAGEVVTGYTKASAAAEQGAAAGFLQACDAAPEGVRQMAAAIRRGYAASAGNVVVIAAFTSDQLDLALARPNVIHAALLAGRASETVLARWRALARYRMNGPGNAETTRTSQEAPRSDLESGTE